jgi:hypothetical protein
MAAVPSDKEACVVYKPPLLTTKHTPIKKNTPQNYITLTLLVSKPSYLILTALLTGQLS